VILSLIASAIIFGSLRANPRLWLNDFPKDIRAAVPPKTADEKRQSLVWGIPFLILLVAIPTLSSIWLERQVPAAGFRGLFLNAFGVVFIFNAVDLLIIDWLVLCYFTPRSLVIPGTEGMAGYKDYGHHFRGFLIGTVGAAVFALLIAAAVYLT
jgi:hypothetical protein